MSQAVRQATKTASAASFLQLMCNRAATLSAKAQELRRSAHSRAVLDQLSDAQLEDVGIDRWAGRPPRPVMEVKAGLIPNLMSMR